MQPSRAVKCLRVLGLPLNASLHEAHEAYRDLMKVWHPDRFMHDDRLRKKAEAKAREINSAFHLLKRWHTSHISTKAQPRTNTYQTERTIRKRNFSVAKVLTKVFFLPVRLTFCVISTIFLKIIWFEVRALALLAILFFVYGKFDLPNLSNYFANSKISQFKNSQYRDINSMALVNPKELKASYELMGEITGIKLGPDTKKGFGKLAIKPFSPAEQFNKLAQALKL